MKKSKPQSASTQKHLPFKSIRDSVVVMRDGSLRAVLMANSINFNLKSRDEQTVLLNSYQNFLNSLSFPLQIVVQSRVLDLDDYLANLDKVAKNQTNELLQTQTTEYIAFVKDLIGVANIMSKTFYIVIPYYPHFQTKQSFWSRLFNKQPVTAAGRMNEMREEVINRASLVANGLAPMGIDSALLDTEELIDLMYSTYNPDTSRRQKLFKVSEVDADVITGLSSQTKRSE